MPLQHLVEYFNDRLGREHRSSFRPFILEEGKVSGLFGPQGCARSLTSFWST